MANDDWLKPQQVLEMLAAAGAQRPEAWLIVAEAMRQGSVTCRAASMTTHFYGEADDCRSDAQVPCDAWILGGVPLPGHTFWATGSVNLTIHLPGSQTLVQSLMDELSLAPISPTLELLGVQLAAAETDLLIGRLGPIGQSIAGGAEVSASSWKGSTKAPSAAKRRGRTPGAGTYTLSDAPLLAEMRRLLAEQTALSVNHAARLVAERARGGGAVDSKASRLARAYRANKQNGGN